MYPSEDRITPAPTPRCASRYAVSSSSSLVASPYPIVRICTTDPETLFDSCCTDSLKMCSGSFLAEGLVEGPVDVPLCATQAVAIVKTRSMLADALESFDIELSISGLE